MCVNVYVFRINKGEACSVGGVWYPLQWGRVVCQHRLKAAGPIAVILNSSACNAIHKCADLRTDISRFAEPAPTWITLLDTYIGDIGTLKPVCALNKESVVFF